MGSESDMSSRVMLPPQVEVVPFGLVSSTAAQVVAANLQALLELNVLVVQPWPEPAHALVAARGQYDAGLILKDLAATEGAPLRLGLMGKDLCLPFLTYVLGESQLGGRAAVMSLHRLSDGEGGGRTTRHLMLERAAKVGLHEIAHVLGLEHCRAAGCLMKFSAGPAGLDRLRMGFCPVCQRELTRLKIELA
ncbi:MAG: peptidase M54 [Proteobacteria bacterium]|nr:peptidase M54 [Pseudomonadota bacterium]MBU1452472.1 peptidase M54 [Pseudomonadota bacterium]MBU2468280.1 peptidase M54 [Pseudomonadota bacterium]